MSKSKINFKKVNKNKIIKILIFVFVLIVAWLTMLWSNNIERTLNSNYYNSDSFNLVSGENCEGESLKVYFIDVGCADATFIEFPDGKKALIDCAGDSLNVEKSCQALSLFLEKNIFLNCEKIIDYLVITHPDSDHYSGAKDILKNYTIFNIIRPKVVSKSEKELFSNDGMNDERDSYVVKDTDSYQSLIDCIYSKLNENSETKMIFAQKGLDFSTSDYTFKFLSPKKIYYEEWNDYSPFIRISYKEKSITLVGDAESEMENEVLDSYGINFGKLKTNVLKIAHHGSNSSSSYELLRATFPETVVVSTRLGVYENVPSSDVLDRVLEVNPSCEILRTDKNGNILVCVDENGNLGKFVSVGSFYYVNHYVFVKWYSVLICFSVCFYIFMFKVSPQKRSNKQKDKKEKLKKEIK